MTDDQLDLARRAVACRAWRWMPGMLEWRPDNNGVPHSIRFLEGVESMEALAGVGTGPLVASAYATYDGYWRSDDITPDLTDAATLGCLLALVREAYGKPLSFCRYVEGNPPFWHINTGHTGATEAAALVAALEVTDD